MTLHTLSKACTIAALNLKRKLAHAQQAIKPTVTKPRFDFLVSSCRVRGRRGDRPRTRSGRKGAEGIRLELKINNWQRLQSK